MLCENVLFLYILKYFNIGINIMRFLIPIVLIIKLVLDIYGQILDPKTNEAKEKITKRILACVIIFFIPTFVNILLGFMENIFGTSFNYSECNANVQNINYYIEKKDKEAALIAEKESEENLTKYAINMEKAREEIQYNLANNSTSSNALVMGQKYLFLSDNELMGLCGVARAEQGTIAGAKHEASLMANRYELLTEDSKYYNKGLYNYVRNSGWFHNAATHMEEGCKPEYLEAVRDVLVNGNRTLPLYVNEHDCFDCNYHEGGRCFDSSDKLGDICILETNGEKFTAMRQISSRSDKIYVPDVTKVYTIYYNRGGKYNYWIFYGFAKDSNDKNIGDPFGYQVEVKEMYDAMNK